MVASTTVRERGFAEAKRLCYAGLDAPTLLREVAGLLGRAAPFETYCAFTNDPLSGLPTQLVGRGALGPRQHRTYIENVYFEEDFDGQRMMVQSRRSVALLSEVTGGKIERALASREITIPLGLGYELFGVCALGRQQWGGISLIRESDSRRRVRHRGELARVTQAPRTASWGTGAFILFAQRRERHILQSSA
jgi:hypothetical protein